MINFCKIFFFSEVLRENSRRDSAKKNSYDTFYVGGLFRITNLRQQKFRELSLLEFLNCFISEQDGVTQNH